ncbi:DUF1826 domain-containing protein [Salmonella enterica subsp. enterica serovar Enteritidis]|nr:DUF1826 domain-containing protein [Salmonella enterica subsp. enterica serovar Enteritidis]
MLEPIPKQKQTPKWRMRKKRALMHRSPPMPQTQRQRMQITMRMVESLTHAR